MRSLLLLLFSGVLLLALAGAAQTADPPTRPPRRVTQHQVLPFLYLRCTVCHGNRRTEGGLDLRTRTSILKGGKSGPAIVPGNPEQSRLLQRVHAGEMPPPRRVVEVSVKPMEPAEIQLVTEWIRQGAPEAGPAAEAPGGGVTERDRQFWSFRPPRRPPVPVFPGKLAPPGGTLRSPVDAFLYRELHRRGLAFAPEAGRRELIRRVTFDLTGLPPTPEEIQTFLADPDPLAYERLVDRLLASPRYGEQWGRRWLDLAGYCDSEGISDSDPVRPWSWRYRDYVVRALNADKPYDRFLQEQIAGDELRDYEKASPVTQEVADNLIATGFLRQTPDGTFANITAFVPDRLDVIHDEMTVLSSSVLGLTLKCARCHDHKFDPLPQRDYYRLLAVFKGAYDEHDWIKPYDGEKPAEGRVLSRELPYVTTEERQAWETREAARKREVEQVRTERKSAQQSARARHPNAGPEEALRKQDEGYRKAAEALEERLKALEARREPAPLIRALWDRGEPYPTYVLHRGEYLQPGEPVGPGVPAVLADPKAPYRPTPPWPGARQTGRRLAFARWLTRPDHPLTARVLVNRIWKHHFGQGLVRSLENFGRTGLPPTHPELLDWLAVEFARDWSLKRLHRLLVTTRAYRQTSRLTATVAKADPENRLLSRMPLRRLEAEELYDALLAVSGRWEDRPFGPPDPVEVRPDGMVLVRPTAEGKWRRSLYALRRRRTPVTFLEVFDFPQLSPNCTERAESTVAPQALQMLNSARLHELAGAFADRVRREVREGGTERRVERATWLALGRVPTAEELRLGTAALARLEAEWRRTGKAGEAEWSALTGYCRGLLNCGEFLYVD